MLFPSFIHDTGEDAWPQQACTSSVGHHTRKHNENGCEHQGGVQDLATHHRTTMGCFSKLIHTGRWGERGRIHVEILVKRHLLSLLPLLLPGNSLPFLFPFFHSFISLSLFLRTLVTIRITSTQYKLQKVKPSFNLSTTTLTSSHRRRSPFKAKPRNTRTSLSWTLRLTQRSEPSICAPLIASQSADTL